MFPRVRDRGCGKYWLNALNYGYFTVRRPLSFFYRLKAFRQKTEEATCPRLKTVWGSQTIQELGRSIPTLILLTIKNFNENQYRFIRIQSSIHSRIENRHKSKKILFPRKKVVLDNSLNMRSIRCLGTYERILLIIATIYNPVPSAPKQFLWNMGYSDGAGESFIFARSYRYVRVIWFR